MSSASDRTRIRSTIQKRDAQGVIRNGAEWLALWSDPESMQGDAAARPALTKNLPAAARALASDPQLSVVIDPETGNPAALRGWADSIALRRRFHDPALHDRLAPADPGERALFDLSETVRCEACGAALFPGIRENLAAAQMERLRAAGALDAHLALLVPLPEGLNMVLRDALTGAEEPSIASPALWMWDRWIRDRFEDQLRELRTARGDQEAFARHAISLIRDLRSGIGPGERLQDDPAYAGDTQGDTPDPDRRRRESPAGPVQFPVVDSVLRLEQAPISFEAADLEATRYEVFTTAHDATVRASELVDDQRLLALRESMERKRPELRRSLARLAARMQRRLLARQNRDWSFDLDEGLLDAARLDRVVTNPGFASAYKQERESNFPDTVVSLLIDNSGSMRGKPIEIACLAADLIPAALERCGIASEILGFTTREWKGGLSARDWVRAGKPANPGRVNDLLQIVYKSAAEPVRRARHSLAAMLDPELLKENIDGEALLWASRRLALRTEKRKILIVISDGAPADQFTLEVNGDKQILDRHLRDVVREIERAGAIELAAIGVKHNAGRYYRRSVEIRDLENLGPGLVRILDKLLCAKPGFWGKTSES